MIQKLSQFSNSQVGNLRNDAYLPYQREAPSLGCASYILRPSKKHYYTRVYFDDSFPFWKNIIKYGWDAQQQVDISNISSIVNHSAQYRSWVILNDSVWSYMMEINISVCNLTYLGVNGNLQGQKLVKGKPKVPLLPPKSRLSNLVPEYFAEALQWLSDMYESDMPACVLAWLGVYGNLQGQKFVTNIPKMSFLTPGSELSSLVTQH